MKIRNAFVSNSSSSSYIITASEHKCPMCRISNLDILSMFREVDAQASNNMSEETHITNAREKYIYKIDRCKGYLTRQSPESASSYLLDDIQAYETVLVRIREEEAKGKNVYYLEISYHDESGQIILRMLRDTEGIEFIFGDEEFK